jgi:hypothetical protein
VTIAATSAERVQRVVDLIEAILTEIATEHDEPLTAAPAISEFISDVLNKVGRIGHERLGAFLRHKHQPDD